MPSGYIKNLAKKTGKSVRDVEITWKKAKAIATRKYSPGSDDYWSYTVGILKSMLKVEFKENVKLKKREGINND